MNKSYYFWVNEGGHRELHTFSVVHRPYHTTILYANCYFAMNVGREEAAYAMRMLRRRACVSVEKKVHKA